MTSIIFFGTPDFVVPVLESLVNQPDFQVIAVITQPDQPVGRKQVLTPSPIKIASEKLNLKVFTPAKLTLEFLVELENHTFQLTNKKQPDLAVLAAYGKIIKPNLLNFPIHGFLNIHPSLLPSWRGATPTLAPILRGDPDTGVSFMIMDELMDHGPIISQLTKLTINQNENRQDLTERLFINAASNLPSIIKSYLNSNISHPQNHDLATFTPILKKQDGFISWETFRKARSSNEIALEEFPEKLRPIISNIYSSDLGAKFLHQSCLALSPWPGLWTITPDEKRLKILTTTLQNNQLHPQLVQLEGSTPTDWSKLSSLHD